MSAAHADAEDTFNLSAKYATQTDSNLFRLSSAQINSGTPANQLETERIDTGSITMDIDKSYSLQRFQLSGSLVDYKYQTYSYLSFNAFNYLGTWSWSATPWLRGTASTSQQKALNNFADYRDSRERNIRTTKTTRVDAEGDIGARWRGLIAVEEASRSNDLPVEEEGDDRVHNLWLGLRYVAPSGNFISYRMRNGQGDYLNREQTLQSVLPSHYDEREQELRMSWMLSGKTTVSARLAHLARSHPRLSVRDYSGPVGDISVSWAPTGKLSIAAVLSRTLATYQTDTTSFVESNRLTLVPTWRLSDHTSLRASYQRSDDRYGGALPGRAPAHDRNDKRQAATIGLDWRPRPTMSFNLSLQNINNQSNTSGFDYKTHGATASAQITF